MKLKIKAVILYRESSLKSEEKTPIYSNIITFTNMDDVPECNWAAGKIESLKYANLGDIYIDGELEEKTPWYYSALDYFNANEIS